MFPISRLRILFHFFRPRTCGIVGTTLPDVFPSTVYKPLFCPPFCWRGLSAALVDDATLSRFRLWFQHRAALSLSHFYSL